MAYIAPRTDIYILRGVSLDKDYEHTVFQTSRESQFNMFNKSQYVKYRLDYHSYQRAGRNKIRVAILCDNLYDCNYLMFRNTAFGDKWFYAFINSIDYINDNTSEINYTIDDMQTWYFDYKMEQCFVEREHTLTDEIGENLVPEKLETGELLPQNKWDFIYPDSIDRNGYQYMFTVWYVPNEQVITTPYTDAQGYPDWNVADVDDKFDKGMIVNGIYMGADYVTYPMDVKSEIGIDQTRVGINRLLDKIVEIGGKIVNIAQVPYYLWQDWEFGRRSRNFAKNMTRENWDSTHTHCYIPKNSKMFTSPYKRIVVSNNAGSTAEYHWERFNNPNRFDFRIQGIPVVSPEIICYPHNYRGISEDYESGLVLNDFPLPPWSEDSFDKWWVQNKESFAMSMISTAIITLGAIALIAASGGAGMAVAGGAAGTAGAAGAIGGASATSLGTVGAAGVTAIGGALKVSNNMGGYYNNKNAPDQISGQIGITSLRTMQNRVGYTFYDMGLEYSMAKSIDNYFSMYGYAIRQVKKPNVRTENAILRPHWNYIETKGCIIHSAEDSGLPSDAESNICRIYDKGITFWKDLNEVGNYDLNNSPQ